MASVSDTLRDKLILDLQAITAANGFNTDLASTSVYPEPKDYEQVDVPFAMVFSSEGGSSEAETLTNRKGYATETYRIMVGVRGVTPNQDLDHFKDDVRNAIERSTGNLLTASAANFAVEMATVTEWGDILTAGELANYLKLRPLTVEVRYIYSRGSL